MSHLMRAQRGFFVRGQPGTPQNELIASTSLWTTDSPPAGVPPHSAEKKKIANLLSRRADWARNRLRSCRSRFFICAKWYACRMTPTPTQPRKTQRLCQVLLVWIALQYLNKPSCVHKTAKRHEHEDIDDGHLSLHTTGVRTTGSRKNGQDPHFTAQQRHRPLCRRTKAERACRICPRTAPADSPQEPQATAEHPQLSVLSRPGTSR